MKNSPTPPNGRNLNSALITTDAGEFLPALARQRPLIGLDLGTKTIGVALSDRLWSVGTAAHIIMRKKYSLDRDALGAFMARHEVGGMALGLPRNMDGTEGPRAQSTRAFARNLARDWATQGVPILLWDERLSTVEAERHMIAADLSRKKRASRIDAHAAAVILQGALDRLSVLRNGG